MPSVPLSALRAALAKPDAPAGLHALAKMEAYDLIGGMRPDLRANQLRLYEFFRLAHEATRETEKAVLFFIASLAGDLEVLFPHLRRMRGLSEGEKRARCRTILWRARAKPSVASPYANPVSWRLADADGEDDTSGISEQPFDRKVDEHSHFLRWIFSVPEPSDLPFALHARCSICAEWGAAPGCDPRCPLPRGDCEPLWFGVALQDPFGLYGSLTGAPGSFHGGEHGPRRPLQRAKAREEFNRVFEQTGRVPTFNELKRKGFSGSEAGKIRRDFKRTAQDKLERGGRGG